MLLLWTSVFFDGRGVQMRSKPRAATRGASLADRYTSRRDSSRAKQFHQNISSTALIRGDPAVLEASGQSTPSVAFLANFAVARKERHLLQAKLSTAGGVPTRIYVKADYLGPSTRTFFKFALIERRGARLGTTFSHKKGTLRRVPPCADDCWLRGCSSAYPRRPY